MKKISMWRQCLGPIGLIALTLLLVGCGYHFPGERGERPARLQNASVEVETVGKFDDPAMARKLKGLIRQKLGLESGSTGDGPVLKVKLLVSSDHVVLTTRAGKASKRQLMLQALPSILVNGVVAKPILKQAEGAAFFEESGLSPMQTQANRQQAENEAMERLADAIAAQFATDL